MPRFVYSPEYHCDIGDHVFRTTKYAAVHDAIIERGLARAQDFLRPEPASLDDLLLAHGRDYLADLMAARRTSRTMRSEMPISEQIVRSFALGAGGTMLACRLAVSEHAFTMNLAGGFHHAFPDWAEGFCYINDVAVGVRHIMARGLVERAMVVDCDLHQGNGTAVIFQHEPAVFTFSIHQQDIYPVKQRSDLDIGLPGHCTGAQYLDRLRRCLAPAIDRHRPQFVLYVAGADPFEGDVLGTLGLSGEDMVARDRLVLGACAQRGIPAAVTLAGGYARDQADLVNVHANTAVVLAEQEEHLREEAP
jgi:acetoin utilization deacetylase AcuC-like enzyme